MITYKDTIKGIAVYVDGKKSGLIIAHTKGYKYVANDGKTESEVFNNLSDLKDSLEG